MKSEYTSKLIAQQIGSCYRKSNLGYKNTMNVVSTCEGETCSFAVDNDLGMSSILY